MSPVLRAVHEADKRERRLAILEAARRLFARSPGRIAPVEAVARAAGLAKGTVYLYFDTKEEVYFALHEDDTARLLDMVEAALAEAAQAAGEAVRVRLVNARVVRHVAAATATVELATHCMSLPEDAVDGRKLLAFKQALALRLGGLGMRVEALFPGLAAGEGARLLMRSYALMIGLWTTALPRGIKARFLEREELAVLRLDYAAELEAGLAALWLGTLAGRAARQAPA